MPPKGALPPGWYCKCPSCDSRHGPTPQVREGPAGPRTMCNKCAVNWFRTWKEHKTPEEYHWAQVASQQVYEEYWSSPDAGQSISRAEERQRVRQRMYTLLAEAAAAAAAAGAEAAASATTGTPLQREDGPADAQQAEQGQAQQQQQQQQHCYYPQPIYNQQFAANAVSDPAALLQKLQMEEAAEGQQRRRRRAQSQQPKQPRAPKGGGSSSGSKGASGSHLKQQQAAQPGARRGRPQQKQRWQEEEEEEEWEWEGSDGEWEADGDFYRPMPGRQRRRQQQPPEQLQGLKAEPFEEEHEEAEEEPTEEDIGLLALFAVASQGHGASPHKPAASAAAATTHTSPGAASSVKQEQQHFYHQQHLEGHGGPQHLLQAGSRGHGSSSPRHPAHKQLQAEDSEVEPSEEEAGLFDHFVTAAAGNSKRGASSEQGPGPAAAATTDGDVHEALGKRGRSAPPVGQAPAAVARTLQEPLLMPAPKRTRTRLVTAPPSAAAPGMLKPAPGQGGAGAAGGLEGQSRLHQRWGQDSDASTSSGLGMHLPGPQQPTSSPAAAAAAAAAAAIAAAAAAAAAAQAAIRAHGPESPGAAAAAAPGAPASPGGGDPLAAGLPAFLQEHVSREDLNRLLLLVSGAGGGH